MPNCPHFDVCRRCHYTQAIIKGIYTDPATPPDLMDLVVEGIINADQIQYKVQADGTKRYKSMFCKTFPMPEKPETWCLDMMGKDWRNCREAIEADNKIKEKAKRVRKYEIRPQRPKIPNEIKRRVWQKCEYKCYYCKTSHWEIKKLADERGIKAFMAIDHIIPQSMGGGENEDNLVLACWRCNSEKSNNKIWVEGEKCQKFPTK